MALSTFPSIIKLNRMQIHKKNKPISYQFHKPIFSDYFRFQISYNFYRFQAPRHHFVDFDKNE